MNPCGKTIGWAHKSSNVMSGCRRGCFYCYARRMAHRLRGRAGYPQDDPFRPTFHPEELERLRTTKVTGQRIFMCSMGELFVEGQDEWIGQTLAVVRKRPDNTHIFLTKNPHLLAKWNPWPANCYVGASATNQVEFEAAMTYLPLVEAPVKFISFEPLLERINLDIAPSNGYNTEYEGEKQRAHSLRNGEGRRIGNRFTGEGVESQEAGGQQMERGHQGNSVCPSQSRKRYREVPSSKNDDRQGEILCPCQQIGMVSLQGGNPVRANNQPQKREREGQSPRQLGIDDLQPTDLTCDKRFGENFQAGQAWPFSWLILGVQTGPGCEHHWPHRAWVDELVRAADDLGVPVYMKESLRKPFPSLTIRQEWPR